MKTRMNLPNAITVFRIFLIPPLVAILLIRFENREVYGVAVYLLGALTDWLKPEKNCPLIRKSAPPQNAFAASHGYTAPPSDITRPTPVAGLLIPCAASEHSMIALNCG